MLSSLEKHQIDFYQDKGFVQIDNVLSTEEVEELRVYMEEVMSMDGEVSHGKPKDGAYFKVLNQKVNPWRDSAGICKFSMSPSLANLALQASGARAIRLFHDHALWKMPLDSKPTPWHQDLPYWPMKEPGALSMWIALDDVDENNGCMMFVPESHKIGKLKGINFEDPQDIFEYTKGTEIENRKPVIVRMKAGSCTLHHGLTFHYAHANHTDKPRRVLAIIYMPDGITYSDHKDHVVTRNRGFKDGDPIQGGFFPILAQVK